MKKFSIPFVIILVFLFLSLNGALLAQEGHDHAAGEARPELTRESSIALNPALGSEIGFVYQAFLSPQQEGGEEEETPSFIPEPISLHLAFCATQ